MLQPSGLLTTHVTTISSRLGVLAQTRAATSTVTARQCASMLLQSDQVVSSVERCEATRFMAGQRRGERLSICVAVGPDIRS